MNTEEKNEKFVRTTKESPYKERFQFLLSVNDNIICQRYFKINGFNNESLHSMELLKALGDDFYETMDGEVKMGVVKMIQNDLESKSRIYMWYTTPSPIQLTGFCGGEKTFLDVPSIGNEEENEKEEPYASTFKFSFLVDDKPVYEFIWDGTQYPRYVRNSVDLSNSDSMYRGRDVEMLNFTQSMVRRMTIGKNDLIYKIIKQICEVTSKPFEEAKYTKEINYGGKNVYLNAYNKEYVDGWRKATKDKTFKYFRENGIPMNNRERKYFV